MKVLGIDPGLHVTGYGIIQVNGDSYCLVEAGVIRTKTTESLELRLAELYTGLNEIIVEHYPDVMSVEEIYSNYRHPRTAVIMGHARGALFLAAGRAGIPVYSYSATRIKKSLTSFGHATKDQVSRMIQSTIGCETELLPSDATDALAAALCHICATMRSCIQ